MISDYNFYYHIVRKLSSLTGGWPYLKSRIKLCRIAFVTMIVSTMLIPHVMKFVVCQTDFQCTFESMTIFLLLIQFLVKLHTFLIKSRNIKNLTDHLFFDWEEKKTPEEYEIMKSYAENSRRFSILYPSLHVAVYIFSSMFLFMSLSFTPQILDIILPLNETRPIAMPYPGYYPYLDERKYFFYIYLHSVVAGEIGVASLVFHDCMFVTFVEHICSMFSIIRFRCTQLIYNTYEVIKTMNVHVDDDLYYKKIKFSVQTHQRVLQFMQLLEDTFTISFLIQIGIITSAMSISLLQVDLQSDTLKTTKFIIYIVGQVLHLFFISYEGQRLIDHSMQMHDTIYDSFWYKLPTKSQKLLVFMMMKSLRPAFLSAGKIYIFSLQSFSMVLHSAVSYYMVLRTTSF